MVENNYIPTPVNTEDVVLAQDLMGLVESLAKNVHEVWAEMRLKQGWTYGKERNDELKEHPCLIPYEELLDSEKVYDRNTAICTLKLIMKLGFKISKE